MRKLLLLLLLLLLPTTVLAVGNETINILPDSNKATFRVDSQNFWKNEIPNILHWYVPKDFVYGGGLHGTSGGCTSPAFSLEAFTNAGNRVTANAVNINYSALGANCSSDVCWVIASASETVPGYQRVGSTTIYSNCSSPSHPPIQQDSVELMKVTLSGGAITTVEDLRHPVSFATRGVYDITDPFYGGVCDGVTDTTAAIQYAMNTVPVGGIISLPEGTCVISQTLLVLRSMIFQGTGIAHTILRQSVPNIPVLALGAVNDVKLQGFTVEHSSIPVAGGDGIVYDPLGGVNTGYISNVTSQHNWRGFVLGCAAYAWGDHLQANNNNASGFEFLYHPNCPTQWNIHHSMSQLNLGAGYFGNNVASSSGIGPFLNDTGSFGNNAGGYVFIGGSGFPIHDLLFYNVASSFDNREGIFLDTYGGAHMLVNPWVELSGRAAGVLQGTPPTSSVASNLGNCVYLTSNNLPGLSITGGHFWNCSFSGVAMNAPFSSLVGGVSQGNGLALTSDLSQRAGVHIGNQGVTVSGHTFNYLNPPATLHYIHMSGALTTVSVGNNTYDPTLTLSDIVDASGATFAGALPPQMVSGLMVHTDVPDAFAFTLFDAAAGAAVPFKFMKVNNGNLEILNNVANVISRLSDQGTPSWPNRRGQVSMADANITTTVTLSPAEPDNAYFVQVTPTQFTGAPAAGAFTVRGVTKNAGSFVITTVAAPGAGTSVFYDWLVYR